VYDNKTTVEKKKKTLNDTEHNKNKKKRKKNKTHYKQKIILDVKYNMYKNHNICIYLYADIHTQTQITICIRRPAEEKNKCSTF